MSRWRIAGFWMLSLTTSLLAAPLPPEVPIGDSLDNISAPRLIAELKSTDGRIRTTATRELFRRHDRVHAALKEVGARNLFAHRFAPNPTRLDMIFTLLDARDLRQAGAVWPGRFVLHVEEGVSGDEVARMGRKYGFAADLAGAINGPAKSRAYTCTVVRAADPVATDRAIYRLLVEERRVISVSFAYLW